MLLLNNKSIGKVRRCRWFLLIKIFVYNEKQCFRYQILVHPILLHCANRIHRNQRCYLSVSLQSYLNQHNSRKRALLTLFFLIFKEGFFSFFGVLLKQLCKHNIYQCACILLCQHKGSCSQEEPGLTLDCSPTYRVRHRAWSEQRKADSIGASCSSTV